MVTRVTHTWWWLSLVLVLFHCSQYSRADLTLFSHNAAGAAAEFYDPLSDTVPCDPNLDESDEHNRLYLFPKSRSCLSQVEKSRICGEYCNKLFKEEQNRTETFETSDDADLLIPTQSGRLNLTGALHFYRSYVHHFLNHLNHQEINSLEKVKFKIRLDLNKNEVTKLLRFVEQVNGSYINSLDHLQDVTEIMKNMLIGVEKLDETVMNNEAMNSDKILIYPPMSSFDTLKIPLMIVLTLLGVAAVYIIMRLIVMNKIGIKVSMRTAILAILLLMFAISVFNNHLYLTQKKQILNQQRLKEMIPEECLLTQDKQTDEKAGYLKGLFKMVKRQFGYSPTSRRCLEYQEALYITNKQINYIETIVFTMSESVRPLAVTFGELINEFYSSLTKDLSFYQYVPLMILVTVVLVPFSLYFLSLISLLLFNYEFNFFHLISFKKSHAPPPPPAQQPAVGIQAPERPQEAIEGIEKQKKEMLKLLGLIRTETRKLKYEMTSQTGGYPQILQNSALFGHDSILKASQDIQLDSVALIRHQEQPSEFEAEEEDENEPLPPLHEVENLNETLECSFRFYFEQKNRKEEELRQQVEKLIIDNKRLNDILTNNSSTHRELKMLNESGDFTNNNPVTSESEAKSSTDNEGSSSGGTIATINNTSSPVKSPAQTEIAIGLSKTVLKSTPESRSSNHHHQLSGSRVRSIRSHRHENDYCDDEDDEEDIFVILDEN